ncbi:hypothetical protein T440DRAFT_272953 [Plenodomus tracheiphilus IPT5]|uniref:Fungal N-terminal domain-containing protein n=1 Tax=Plenodomus tracheiphilus IPT5 TaxID=1408161 RepID=A0A6A7BFY7_9PLEO|nr:hypothetical protein T440DRAFT_272953 [Plenodomus tracheiphilus IPT5]
MTVPNVGDILMLSQTAWRIERAFAAGRKDAPTEFQVIEVEIGGLARALKLLAEALHASTDFDTLRTAGETIQNGISTVISSCQRTVSDLDSLIDQHQVIKKHRTVGGFAIERTWSDLVLAGHKTMLWTTEGGGLQDLKELLQLHTNSITLTIQAIQSKSLYELESVIGPIAGRIDSMYQSSKSVPEQVGEIQDLVHDFAITEPIMQAPPVPRRNPARSPTPEVPNPLDIHIVPPTPLDPSLRRRDSRVSTTRSHQRSPSSDRPKSPNPSANNTTLSSPSDTMFASRASSPTRKRVSDFSFGVSSLRYSSSSYASSDAGVSTAGWSTSGVTKDTFSSYYHPTSSKKSSPLPRTPEVPEPGQRANGRPLSLLPPPALGLSMPYELERHTSNTSRNRMSVYPSSQSGIMKLHRSSTTASQKAAFEKEAFRNSAVLCDVRGKLVEYSHQLDEVDRNDVEMVTASEECRIAVVRKRITDSETRKVRVATSVWTFSDDGTVRMELRMADDQMYIPYSSYFSLSKVSITVPCDLKFHDVKLGNRPVKVAKTTWVNYVFESSDAAALFQNELMGRTLLATFRTEKTMRVHEGIGATFNYAQQMCALENLRVWEDNDTGAIIALIHFSASFRSGYLAFYLNSSVNPIKVKDDGGREVKIKGLRVPIDKGDKAVRKDSVVASSETSETKGKGKEKEDDAKKKMEKGKVISGARIEFRTDAEKREFMEMCWEMQKSLIELPDLMGVN